MSEPRTRVGRRFVQTVRAAVLDPTVAKLVGDDGREQLVALVSVVAIEDAILGIEAEAAAGPGEAAVWNIDANGIPRSPEWWDGYRVGMAADTLRQEEELRAAAKAAADGEGAPE